MFIKIMEIFIIQIFEYYYYNANIWVLESEYIGGNTLDWYVNYDLDNVAKYLDRNELIKEIYVPEKIVNFVVKMG